MNPLISVVIPVYNVENFLRSCMDTVLKQTYDNFEVILVDDGSTDGCPLICDEYANMDSRVSTYHKENGGLSDARNYGIGKANAELIALIDSDDYVAIDYLEYLYGLMSKSDADMAWACAESVFNYDEPIDAIRCTINEEVLNPGEALEKMCYLGNVSAFAKLYKKRMLLDNPFPAGRIYEDLATTYKIMGSCKKIATSNRAIYFHLEREGSIMHSKISDRQYDVIWAADNQLKYISANYPEAIKAAKARCIESGLTLINIIFAYNCSDRRAHFKRVRNYMKPYMRETFKNSKTRSKIKVYCLAVFLGYIPSKLFWGVKNLMKKMIGRASV